MIPSDEGDRGGHPSSPTREQLDDRIFHALLAVDEISEDGQSTRAAAPDRLLESLEGFLRDAFRHRHPERSIGFGLAKMEIRREEEIQIRKMQRAFGHQDGRLTGELDFKVPRQELVVPRRWRHRLDG